MRILLVILSILGLFANVNNATAQKRKNKKAANESTFQLQNSNVWKVSGNGLESPSYIMGTIHMICDEKYDWSEKLQKAYEATEQVGVELNISDMSVQMELAKSMMAQDGKKLSSYFTEEEYKNLSEMINGSSPGVDISMFENFTPGILVSMVAMSAYTCPVKQSYDMNVIAKATKDEKNIISLETAAYQANLLSKLTSDEKMKEFKLLLHDDTKDSMLSVQSQQLEQLMGWYAQEDLKAIHTFYAENEEAKELMADGFGDDRNIAWIPKIETTFKEKTTFLAVGIAHLTGENGILKLLHEKGYTVEPVMD